MRMLSMAPEFDELRRQTGRHRHDFRHQEQVQRYLHTIGSGWDVYAIVRQALRLPRMSWITYHTYIYDYNRRNLGRDTDFRQWQP